MCFILKFFKSLPHSIEYAIERGLDDVSLSSKGDLDVLIRKPDFPIIIKAARSAGILISSSITYGGARIFLGDDDGNIKRVDFDWFIHYKGIPLDSVEHYINRRQKDPETELFVLAEKEHAAIINHIKNSYGGAEKYRQFLEKNNYRVLNKRQRAQFIFATFIRYPFTSIMGKIRYSACYLLRAIYPTGLSVYGLAKHQLESNQDIMYLFQNRISSSRGSRDFLNTHFLSRLSITPNPQHADIVLKTETDNAEMTATVVKYLRSMRTHIPTLLFKMA